MECLKCNKKSCDLVTCDQCKVPICASCRHEGRVDGIWVITFCYDCQPQLEEK